MSDKLINNCLKFSTTFLFLLFFQPLFSQVKKKNDKEFGVDNYAELDATLTRFQKQLGNNFVALIWRDTLVFKKEFGEFNSKTEAPLAGSSRWLTTALILMLVDEGKLSLDDKVSDHLPVFSSYGKNYITLRHCLTHFTGIQAGTKLTEGKFASLEEGAVAFAKKEIQTNPGTEFRYSNAGIIILGRIAEIVTKKKFDQLIKQRLFSPLGMTKTSFGTMDGSAPNPADGARSSANDYIRFLTMLMNNGKFNNKQLLSEAAVKELRKIQATTDIIKFAPKATAGLSYATGGWVLEEKEGLAGALTSPGFFGSFPVVDWCRGYSFFFLPKELLGEQKSEAYLQMKAAVDNNVRNKCD